MFENFIVHDDGEDELKRGSCECSDEIEEECESGNEESEAGD